MFKNSFHNKFIKMTMAVMTIAFLCLQTVSAPSAHAMVVNVAADATATAIATKSWIEEAWVYVRNKMATVLFQNILRKVLNDFAKDAGTWLGSGGKGQQALYIQDKWDNFWANVGDKAAGDFVETFANSVIADIAYSDVKSERTAVCNQKRNECTGSEADCVQAYNTCLQGAGEDPVCQKSYKTCTDGCGSDETCLSSCVNIFNSCNQSSSYGLNGQRIAPYFNKNSPLAKINVCNPRLDVSMAISLGLVNYNTGWRPDCTFSEMTKNWTSEYQRLKDMADPSYLKKVITNTEITNNELGVSLMYYNGIYQYQNQKVQDSEKITIANKGWLDVTNWAGELSGTPGEAEARKKLTEQALWDNLGKVTGDILTDASTIFLNQLAITGWQNLISSLNEDDNASASLSKYYAGSSSKRQAIENKISKLIEPTFAEPGKLDIIRELAACSDSQKNKPAVNNCVITSKFADAITSKMTVIEAVNSNRIPGDLPFGFNKFGEDTLEYDQGYPYRSLVILRKYRILPVGWELAAQEIQRQYKTTNSGKTEKLLSASRPNGISLNDLLSCYSAGDTINNGFNEEWCRGLIDPYWVLKVPDYYCGAKGNGPNMQQDPVLTESGIKYCSDEKGTAPLKVDGNYRDCTQDTDCCNKEETVAKEQYLAKGDTKRYKEPCIATCTYKEKKLQFSRADNYCADEKSCIKNGKDGSCLAYGYCTEEQRTWVFNREGKDSSCEPLYNSCNEFKNSDGKTRQLLADTLDYGACDQNNVGCKRYSRSGDYDSLTNKIAWNDEKLVPMNKNVKDCKDSEEGCHEFIRIKSGSGSNLLADGDFEKNDTERWKNYGEVVKETAEGTKVYSGENSLHVKAGSKGVYYGPDDKSLLPAGFEFEDGQTYTLSAYIYTVSGDVTMSIGSQSDANAKKSLYSSTTGEWEEFVLTVTNDFQVKADMFKIAAFEGTAEFYVDSIKLEVGGRSNYSAYASNNLTYLKQMPWYLEPVCYNNAAKEDYTLKENAPAICSKFVRKCKKEEVGCELYTDVKTQDSVAAKVKAKDYCPGECVGFDTFMQKENNFYSEREDHFIPKTAKTCRADAAGCSLLVNLDKVAQGGEGNEYYSQIRRCVKKDSTCGKFYTWEGSAESGYQMTVYELQVNEATKDTALQPFTYDDDNNNDSVDAGLCDETIFGLPSDHPDYNPNCRQFYGTDGHVSYHLYEKTVECSDDCHPYRLVENNLDYSISSLSACNQKTNNGQTGHWDGTVGACVVCKAGGLWSDQHQACIYQAIPGGGKTCSASEVGCSEYTGNFGNKVKVIFNDTFENNLGGWNSGLNANNVSAKISSEAVKQGGHSLTTTSNFVSRQLSGQIKPGKKYVLSFLAKSKSGKTISSISFSADNLIKPEEKFAEGVKLSADWRIYRFSINDLSRATIDEISILFEGNSNDVYLDDLKLLEYDDRYFLMRNSWVTPDSCNKDYNGADFPLYMLGCKEYKDSQNNTHYLRSFDSLCQLSGVGCEAMIDTFNSLSYKKTIYNDHNKDGKCDGEADCLEVPADKITYITYDSKKSCYSQQKGCSRLGLFDMDKNSYSDTYKVVNPDEFASVLCKNQDVGCAEWADTNGSSAYFKDPGNKVCEYRQAAGSDVYGWFKKKMSRCFADKTCSVDSDCSDGYKCLTSETTGEKKCSSGIICSSGQECTNGDTCLLSNSDEACAVTQHKTIGNGVVAAKEQPVGMSVNGYAGACNQASVGCTEYIDPTSQINYNILAVYDGSAKSYDINPDSLYILKSTVNAGSNKAKITCTGGSVLYYLDANNNIVGPVAEVVADSDANYGYSKDFYVVSTETNIDATTNKVKCTVSGKASDLKEAIVAYKLKDSLYDTKPTEVSLVKGGVLFNERSWSAGKPQTLVYNSDKTVDGKAPAVAEATPPGNNANKLLKVDPDRRCSKWLGCRSYGINPLKLGEKMCYERALCNQLNDAGECVNFIEAPKGNQTYDPDDTNKRNEFLARVANMSGYAKAGFVGNLLSADLYNLGSMYEVGDMEVKFDGSFENAFDTGFWPVGTENNRQNSLIAVVRDAAVIQKELGEAGYSQIPDGQVIGKSSGCIETEVVGMSGDDYVASAYVFIKSGTEASLKIASVNNNSLCPVLSAEANGQALCLSGQNYATVAKSNESGQWTRLTGRFKLADNYRDQNNNKQEKVKIQLCSGNGLIYFDNIKIEPALKVKDETYVHPSCRLYPERTSTACEYYTDSGIRKKGWTGYCLESDPRNPAACLLWYPIDKVESEEFEEGVALEIPKDLYYCIDAEDQCNTDNPVEPEFYCKTFLKVDKDSYWYSRINNGSGYIIPYQLLRTNNTVTSTADFGVDATNKIGGKVGFQLNQSTGAGYYGALSMQRELGYGKETMGISGLTAANKKLYPFVPYYGKLLAESGNRQAFCKATIDSDKKDKPIEVTEGRGCDNTSIQILGNYDDCYVGASTQWLDCADGQNGIGLCCPNWTPNSRSNGSGCAGSDHWKAHNPWLLDVSQGNQNPRCGWGQGSGGDVRCTVYRDNGVLKSRTTDTGNDGDEVGCFYDCYYHANSYSVARNKEYAVYAVNRLFTKQDPNKGCYEWDNNAKKYSSCGNDNQTMVDRLVVPSGQCPTSTEFPQGKRPEFNQANGTADLCWVKPWVKQANISTNLNKETLNNKSYYIVKNRGWVQLSFTSEIDKDQLPLKKYSVYWGYKGTYGNELELSRSVNMMARPGTDNPHTVMHFYDYEDLRNDNSLASCGNGGKQVSPGVVIEDNWGKSSRTVSNEPVRIETPICVLP